MPAFPGSPEVHAFSLVSGETALYLLSHLYPRGIKKHAAEKPGETVRALKLHHAPASPSRSPTDKRGIARWDKYDCELQVNALWYTTHTHTHTCQRQQNGHERALTDPHSHREEYRVQLNRISQRPGEFIFHFYYVARRTI